MKRLANLFIMKSSGRKLVTSKALWQVPYLHRGVTALHSVRSGADDPWIPTIISCSTSSQAFFEMGGHTNVGKWSRVTSDREGPDQSSTSPLEEPKDERREVLVASLSHVNRLGWTQAALEEGAKDAGFSPSIVGMFQRKEAELVEFFMEECCQGLKNKLAEHELELSRNALRDRIVFAIRERLEMQALYTSSWPQALSIQARPANLPSSFRQRAELLDAIWRASADQPNTAEYHANNLMLGAAYSAVEVYMLTDFSPGFQDTWLFLERQVDGILQMKKNAMEAGQAAIAVGSQIQKSIFAILRGEAPGPP